MANIQNSLFVSPSDAWILDIGIYFKILDKINKSLISLMSETKIEIIEFTFFYLSTEIYRILPIQRYELNKNDGILKLKNYFPFLLNDYNAIFDNYKSELIIINKVRNKYQHAPHTIHFHEFIGNNSSKQIEFVYVKNINKQTLLGDVDKWVIKTQDLKKIVIDLNNVFNKIKKMLEDSISKRNYNYNHPYIESIEKTDLDKYNKELSMYL